MKHLALVLVLVLAGSGCLGTVESNEPVLSQDGFSEGSIVLAKNRFITLHLPLDAPTRVNVTVDAIAGRAAEVILLDLANFWEFHYDRPFQVVEECTGLADSHLQGLCLVDAGDYVLILDNSDGGRHRPDWNTGNDATHVAWTLTTAT